MCGQKILTNKKVVAILRKNEKIDLTKLRYQNSASFDIVLLFELVVGPEKGRFSGPEKGRFSGAIFLR